MAKIEIKQETNSKRIVIKNNIHQEPINKKVTIKKIKIQIQQINSKLSNIFFQ